MSNTNDFKNKNTKFTGVEGVDLPVGTTAQRSGSPTAGTIRYNSDLGLAEIYTATGWAGVDAPPVVSGLTGIINEDTDTTITINGSGFKPGAIISVTGLGVNNVSRNLTTTYVGSSSLTANTNASAVNYVSGATFTITVTNPSGLTGQLDPAGTIDQDPIWSTPAGLLGTIADQYGSYSPAFTLSATDPDGEAVTYSIVSGSLPAGMSLNTSNGQITGQPTAVGSSTNSPFTVRATDADGGYEERAFSITVDPAPDGSTAAKAGTSALAIKNLTGTTTDGTYYLKDGSGNTYQAYCLMSNSYDSGGWTHIMSIRTADGTLHHFDDTTWWQNASAVGTPSAWYNDTKTEAFWRLADFTQILMMSYDGNGNYRAHSRWSFTSPYNTNSYTFRDIMLLPNSSTGQNVVTGTRQVQSGSTTGATINTARPQSSWGCEFIDNGSGSGQEIVVNWYGQQTGAKFSSDNDTRNHLRITTANRGSGYPHTFGGIGGFHERPPGSYPAQYEYEPVHAYCDPPYHFGSDGFTIGQTGGYCGQGSQLDRSIAIFLK